MFHESCNEHLYPENISLSKMWSTHLTLVREEVRLDQPSLL